MLAVSISLSSKSFPAVSRTRLNRPVHAAKPKRPMERPSSRTFSAVCSARHMTHGVRPRFGALDREAQRCPDGCEGSREGPRAGRRPPGPGQQCVRGPGVGRQELPVLPRRTPRWAGEDSCGWRSAKCLGAKVPTFQGTFPPLSSFSLFQFRPHFLGLNFWLCPCNQTGF